MRILTFLEQPPHRRRLIFEAIRELLRAWWLVRFRRFRTYSETLGMPHAGAFQLEEGPADATFLRDLRWAIHAVNRTFGGRFTCLMQGIAGKAMLNRRDIANTLILGARLKGDDDAPSDEGMAAHAWLCAGPVVLLGGDARKGYVPVTSYHSS